MAIAGLILSFHCLFSVSQPIQERPRIGLVLSGGAAKGLAHIGVLKVLEKASIPVDMVAGTSMGSIIGGLYALGYSADSLEKIALSQNWSALLLDEVSRNNLTNDEKDEFDKYMVSFPVKDLRPRLPGGLKTGQNISLFLNRLTFPAFNINDFSEFPRPFICIAADIVTGEEVVLKSGNLAQALRASMAIPTVFTPVKIDNRLLVDGGIVNNFPADRLKEMGADIIIGVNLGFRLHSEADLNSLSSILEQSVFFRAAERNQQNQKLVDILIQPDVYKNFTAASFNEAAKLIAEGERAARAAMPQLQALANQLAEYHPVNLSPLHATPNFLHITEITLNGLKNVSEGFVINKIKLHVPGTCSLDDIESSVQLLYGTRFFNKVEYLLEQKSDSSINLIFNFQETDYDMLRIGGKFDTDNKAALFINTTFRNILMKGSRLSLDFRLGEITQIKASYTVHSALHTSPLDQWINAPWLLVVFPDITFTSGFNRYEYYLFLNDLKSAIYNISTSYFQLKSTNNLSNAISIGSDFSFEYAEANTKFFSDSINSDWMFANLGVSLLADTRDSYMVPSRGIYASLRAEAVQNLSTSKFLNDDFIRLIGHCSISLPIIKNKLIITPHTIFGYNTKEVSTPNYKLFIGGNKFHPGNSGSFPFPGIQYFEKSGNAVLVQKLEFQFQFKKNHYFLAEADMGTAHKSLNDLLYYKPFFGASLSYCYNSLIGPLLISLNSSEIHPGPSLYITIGYRF